MKERPRLLSLWERGTPKGWRGVRATAGQRGAAPLRRFAPALPRESRRTLLALAALGLVAAAPTPAGEARAHALFRQIRCVVCQNESIDDSGAELAGDLRAIVREQIAAGRSDVEIRRFLTDRYGEFVLLRPRMSAANALLWTTPFALAGGGLGVFALRRRRPGLTPELSVEEEAQLRRIAGDAAVTLPPDTRLRKGLSVR